MFPSELVTFTEEIHNEKLEIHCLGSTGAEHWS